jgi:hypothetical protein
MDKGHSSKKPVTAHLMRGVYVHRLIGTDCFKIGYSQNIPKRKRQLQWGLPYRLQPLCYFEGDQALEAKLKAAFTAYRIWGEWFRIPPEFINDMSGLIRVLNDAAHKKGRTSTLILFTEPQKQQTVQQSSKVVPLYIVRKATSQSARVSVSGNSSDAFLEPYHIVSLFSQLSSEFSMQDLAPFFNMDGANGYASLRKACNMLVRSGRLERMKRGRYRILASTSARPAEIQRLSS